MGNCSTSDLKEAFQGVNSNVDGKLNTAIQNTPNRMLLLDPRSPLVDAERTPIERLKYEMGNCSIIDLKAVSSNINNRRELNHTPDKMVLLDPRSPLVDAERTPIEVLPKTTIIPDDVNKTDDGLLSTRQLADPRSATAGIQRTPILVESPLPLEKCALEDGTEKEKAVEVTNEEAVVDNLTSTPIVLVKAQEKVLPIAKKLSFDVSPLPRKMKKAVGSTPARVRSPLADLHGNSPVKSENPNNRQVVSKAKVQGPMSPLQLLHVRQRIAVKRALQRQGENCPPQTDGYMTTVNLR